VVGWSGDRRLRQLRRVLHETRTSEAFETYGSVWCARRGAGGSGGSPVHDLPLFLSPVAAVRWLCSSSFLRHVAAGAAHECPPTPPTTALPPLYLRTASAVTFFFAVRGKWRVGGDRGGALAPRPPDVLLRCSTLDPCVFMAASSRPPPGTPRRFPRISERPRGGRADGSTAPAPLPCRCSFSLRFAALGPLAPHQVAPALLSDAGTSAPPPSVTAGRARRNPWLAASCSSAPLPWVFLLLLHMIELLAHIKIRKCVL
jgi:hypothetical protein